MRQLLSRCSIVLLALPATLPADAAPVARGALPCLRTTVATRKAPVGPAQFQSGRLTLANGATLRLQGTPAELRLAADLAVGDPVAACYGPLKTYADAGPARTITVLDLANGSYYGSLVGDWRVR